VTVVVVLVLGWWDQADLTVQAAVVEPVDVFGDGASLGHGQAWACVDANGRLTCTNLLDTDPTERRASP